MRFLLVEVLWLDSFNWKSAYWDSAKKVIKFTKTTMKPIRTVGYLLYSTNQYIIISQSLYRDKTCLIAGGYFCIPVGSIVKINYINNKKKKNNDNARSKKQMGNSRVSKKT